MNEEYENTRLCAAKLLQTICENVDGLITFVGVLANELIDYSVQQSMNKDIKLESEYPNLASVPESGLIQLSAESKIDLGLNVLIIVQDQIDFRLDIKDQILENLIRYLQQLLTSGVDPIISARGL
jgi:hypothetical protein